MRVTPAYLESVATFYDMLETSPTPPHDVYVCTNISCSLRGADELYAAIRAASRREDGSPAVNVRSFECLGACDIAPMASVDGVYVGPLTAQDVPVMLAQIGAGEPVLPDKQLVRRPVADPRANAASRDGREGEAMSRSPLLLLADIDEPGLHTREVYERRGGYESLRRALQMTPEDVLANLEASGLRGRGGAGFAMGKKVSFLPKGAIEKYLVCNADESEPGTFKDRELLQKNPHMLLEGIVIASYAAGAARSFIYIRGEYQQQADVLDAALAEARAAGYVGEDILGSGHTLSLVVHRGAGAYICGEETGLLDSLEGKRGNPAPEAPVPRQPGPLPGTDADQQRRDALHRSRDHPHGRRGVREAGRRDLDRHQGRVGVRARAAPGQLRGRARRSPRARSSTASRAARRTVAR